MPSPDPIGDKPRAHEVHVKAVREFGDAMIAKLDANAHKGHWRDCTIEYLLKRLQEEVEELYVAAHSVTDDADEEARAEAADVANLAMMLFERFAGRDRDASDASKLNGTRKDGGMGSEAAVQGGVEALPAGFRITPHSFNERPQYTCRIDGEDCDIGAVYWDADKGNGWAAYGVSSDPLYHGEDLAAACAAAWRACPYEQRVKVVPCLVDHCELPGDHAGPCVPELAATRAGEGLRTGCDAHGVGLCTAACEAKRKPAAQPVGDAPRRNARPICGAKDFGTGVCRLDPHHEGEHDWRYSIARVRELETRIGALTGDCVRANERIRALEQQHASDGAEIERLRAERATLLAGHARGMLVGLANALQLASVNVNGDRVHILMPAANVANLAHGPLTPTPPADLTRDLIAAIDAATAKGRQWSNGCGQLYPHGDDWSAILRLHNQVKS